MAELTKLRRSPLTDMTEELLDGAVTGDRHVRVFERRFGTMLTLRVDPASPAARAIEAVVGTALPRRSGDVGSHGQHSLLWQGPDEWLMFSHMSADVLVPALTASVAGGHAAVVDVSANRTVLELTGASARAVLQKGCPLDLHPREFGPGRAVATTLARIPLVLWQVEPDSYLLLPRSSFADYVARWLLDASREFACDVTDGTGR